MILNMRPLCLYCREALAGLEDLAFLDLSHNMINKREKMAVAHKMIVAEVEPIQLG